MVNYRGNGTTWSDKEKWSSGDGDLASTYVLCPLETVVSQFQRARVHRHGSTEKQDGAGVNLVNRAVRTSY